MLLDPRQMTTLERYKIATGSILPRPIAWVSSRNEAGLLNLAPFSFFTIVATEPLTLVVCPQLRMGQPKDTLTNIAAIGEYVINIAGEDALVQMNATSAELPPHISEFEVAGVTPVASERVSVPRVAEAAVAFECRLQQIVTSGNGSAVFGTVESIWLRDALYDEGRILLHELQPIARLAGNFYARVTDIYEMARG